MKLLPSLILLGSSMAVQSQTVIYTYDNAGRYYIDYHDKEVMRQVRDNLSIRLSILNIIVPISGAFDGKTNL